MSLVYGLGVNAGKTPVSTLPVVFISKLWTTKRTVSSKVIKTSFSLLCSCLPNSLSQLLLNKTDAFSPLFIRSKK